MTKQVSPSADRRPRRRRSPHERPRRAPSWRATLLAAVLAAVSAACAPANPLLGNWVADPPGVPRAHGSLVGFREACVIVAGSDRGARIAAPVRYAIAANSGLLWFGAAAGAPHPTAGDAAKISFLAPDRIAILWPDGHESRYLRGLGPADPAPGEDCGGAVGGK